MDIRRIQQRLNSATSKESQNVDNFLKVNLESSSRLLPTDQINKIIDVGEQFNKERQSSKFYRLIGTLYPLVSNVLFNITGSRSWSSFNDPIFKKPPLNSVNTGKDDLTYSKSIDTYLREVDGWWGYFDPDIRKSGLCNYFDMEPTRNRFSFTPDINNANKKNWELTITYPYISDKTHYMVNDGLIIFDKQSVSIGGRNMIALGTPVLHNLTIGNTVRINGTNFDGDYTVISTGLNNGDLKGYYFAIDLDDSVTNIGSNSRMKKVFAGQESEYYFRKFKKIKTRSSSVVETDDYEIYNVAFSQNIYNDPITQFVFNEDIDVSDLTDNLGRPLSELYLTMVKTNSSDNVFSFGSVSSGIEVPFMAELNNSSNSGLAYLRDIPVIHKIHNGGSSPFPTHTPLESNITISDTDFYGDVVEYNRFQVIETVLGNVCHRFNTINRETIPVNTSVAQGARQEGYYYKAHQLIKIRDFSTYIEQGDLSTFNIPSYAEDLGDGRFLWRDLLDIGFNDAKENTLDYPFLNGSHYIYQNYCFGIKRQDPFAHWELYYPTFPGDPIGDSMTDNFTINQDDDVC